MIREEIFYISLGCNRLLRLEGLYILQQGRLEVLDLIKKQVIIRADKDVYPLYRDYYNSIKIERKHRNLYGTLG